MLLLHFTLLLLSCCVFAQFNFFDMFGQQQQQQHQQQQASGGSQWASHADSGSPTNLLLHNLGLTSLVYQYLARNIYALTLTCVSTVQRHALARTNRM
jgi:hypothetical protein